MALSSSRSRRAIRLAGCLLASAVLNTTGRTQEASTPLVITSSRASLPVSALLSGDATAWAVPSAEIHLNRTPPLFETDPRDNGIRPVARVQVQRADNSLYVRFVWNDSTADSVPAAMRYPDAGEAAIYKRQSEHVDKFLDAACVMVPKQTDTSGPLPSLMMGAQADQVWLYYWRNGRGFERLEAAGRGTTASKGVNFPGKARYEKGQWVVVFEIPASQGARTPMAFAIWNGSQSQRDGLKFYSLWYEVAL